MPLARHPEVGFPVGAGAFQQTADHVLAEELDEVGGDAALQHQGGTVLDTAALAGLAHRAAFHKHEDGDAVARRVGGQEALPVQIAGCVFRPIGFLTIELKRLDDVMQGAGIPRLELDLAVQPVMPRLAVDLTARRHDIAASRVITPASAASSFDRIIRRVSGGDRVACLFRRVHHPSRHQGGVLDDFLVLLAADLRDEPRCIAQAGYDLSWMDPAIRAEWTGLASVIMVHRHTLHGAGKTRSETSYHMSSLPEVRAPEMLGYIRGHWGIENRCHWVLDAIHREDNNQTRDRNSAANHSILRRMALNAHNRMPLEGKKHKSLPKRQLRATHDTQYLEQLLSLL